MKKIICALMMYVCFVPAFADSWDFANGKEKEIFVPFSVFSRVLADGDFSSVSEENMLNKYMELTGSYGTKKLSVSDVLEICNAGGITSVSDCYTKIVNPAITIMRAIRFENVCTGRVTGGVQHCVDDVFVKSYSMMVQKSGSGYNPHTDIAIGGDKYLTPGSVRIANTELAQDVRVSENMAFGFAWEYAKRDGNDVICSPNIVDNFINCTTPDNKHFYTFKFFDTHNTSDSTIEENLVRGICAMYMEPFVDKGFNGISSDGAMGLNINTNSDYGCEMDCAYGTDVHSVIGKFGLIAENGYSAGNRDLGMYCKIHRLSGLGDVSVAKYPGYDYMSYAFQEIQTVLEPSLINVLKNYVRAQGIDVKSFDCDYGTMGYTGAATVAGTVVPTGDDDILRCRLNGRDVDFIFDDLFESKRSARDVGKSGMRCLLMNREYAGGTASFDGKYCKGPTQAQCTELGKQISGGTHWDDAAGACVLNDAAAAKNLQTVLTITGGAAFAVGVTLLSGGSAGIVLLEVGAGLATDLAFEGINRFYETRPNKLATEYVRALQNCGMVGGDDARMCMNKQCIQDVVGKYIASIDDIIGDGVDALNDNQLQIFESVNERVNNCLTDVEIQSALKSSEVTSKDKFVSRASMALMVGGFFISPSNAVTKLKRLPKTAQILRRAGLKPIERVSSSLGNVRYHRIYVQDLSLNDIRKMTDELQMHGFYVSSNMDDTGKQFIGFADSDIFGPWHNSKGNWLFGGAGNNTRGIYKSMQDVKNIDFGDLKSSAVYDNIVTDWVLSGFVDNSDFFSRLNSVQNREIARIGSTPVKIVDAGSNGGRAIVVVDVGGRNIPFYVSTGSAGKISVPTGKWEVFWGIGETGWFNKTNLYDIENHYGSSELKMIASRLDEVLGDPRNRLYLNASESRALQGGVGLVADVDNMNAISITSVNSGLRYTPNSSNKSGEANLRYNIEDMTNYLRSLR